MLTFTSFVMLGEKGENGSDSLAAPILKLEMGKTQWLLLVNVWVT